MLCERLPQIVCVQSFGDQFTGIGSTTSWKKNPANAMQSSSVTSRSRISGEIFKSKSSLTENPALMKKGFDTRSPDPHPIRDGCESVKVIQLGKVDRRR